METEVRSGCFHQEGEHGAGPQDTDPGERSNSGAQGLVKNTALLLNWSLGMELRNLHF